MKKNALEGIWHQSAAPVALLFLLVLLRPVLDTTWHWKETGFGVSLLQIVGVLLPLFLLWALWRRRKDMDSLLLWRHAEVIVWLLLSLFSGLAVLSASADAETAGMLVKFILPAVFIVFGMLYLRERPVLDRLAVVMALSVVVPLLFVLYEVVFGPMSLSTRSGVLRFSGPYAQVSVYGIHFSMGLLGVAYLYLRNRTNSLYLALLVVLSILALAIPWVVHMTTWAVIGGLFVVLIVTMLWRKEWLRVAVFVAIPVVVLFLSFSMRPSEDYARIVAPDIGVIRGDAPVEYFGNSRGLIWKNYLQQYAGAPVYAQLFGMPYSGQEDMSGTGFGAHNDFLRILMATGVVGLLLYFIWLVRTIRAVLKLRGELLFFGVGALIIWLGFSVGLTPTYIVPLSTVILPILGGLSEISRRNQRQPQDAQDTTQDTQKIIKNAQES
jgi:O-antigen ligase